MLTQKHSSRSASASCTKALSRSRPWDLFRDSTTPFQQRDVVRVPLRKGGIGSEGVLLQKKSDGKEDFVVLDGGVGGGLVLAAAQPD